MLQVEPKPATRRGRGVGHPWKPTGWDGRTARARELKGVYSRLLTCLPSDVILDDGVRLRVAELAELHLAAQALRRQLLDADRKLNISNLLRLEGLIARLTRELGLAKPRTAKPQGLREYLRDRGSP